MGPVILTLPLDFCGTPPFDPRLDPVNCFPYRCDRNGARLFRG